jgi:hypothetical protein
MIGTSVADYVFIRTSILLLHCIAPLSVLYCVVVSIGLGTTFRTRREIELWLFAEALFWTCFFLPYRWHLQHAAIHPPSRSREERRKLVGCVLAEMTDAERYIRGWFKGADFEVIGREDFKDWLAWAFFDSERGKVEDADEIESYTLQIERILRKDFSPGRGTVTPLRLTIDPVDMLHRSLLWYLVSGLS